MTLIRLTDTRSPEQLFSSHESNMSKSRQSRSQPEQRGDCQPTVPRQALTTPKVPDNATAKARIMPFALSTIFPLTKHSQPYISPDFLKTFPNIKVCRDKLSFDDGTLPSEHEQFLQPLPRDHVDELLHRTQPWRDEGVLKDFIPDDTIKNLIIPLTFSTSDRWGDNFQDARVLWRALDEHMGRNGTGDPEQKNILENYTPWKYFRYCSSSPPLLSSPFSPSLLPFPLSLPLSPFTPPPLLPSPFSPSPLPSPSPFTRPPEDMVFLSETIGFVLLTFNRVTDTNGCVAFMSRAPMEKTLCIGKPRHSFVLV
ncbi:unnamed protein product, partial [Clonostachys rosea f. rosea IK726]